MQNRTEKPKARDFTFRLQGHGQDVPAGTYKAESEEKAFRVALKACKPFTLPGWHLVCVESGTSQAVAQFVDGMGDKVRQ